MTTHSAHKKYAVASALAGVRRECARALGLGRAAAASPSQFVQTVINPAPWGAGEVAGAPAMGRLGQQILDNQI